MALKSIPLHRRGKAEPWIANVRCTKRSRGIEATEEAPDRGSGECH